MGRIQICISQQALYFYDDQNHLKQIYPVSTAQKGVGCQKNSEQTPLGKHIVRAKIGAGLPENAVLVGRRPTGEIYTPLLGTAFPERDWILSRILWLSGLELGKNRLGNCDTMQRYIYIHGCPDSVPMGVPMSHGCIRMRNRDIIQLFDQIPVGMPVDIVLSLSSVT